MLSIIFELFLCFSFESLLLKKRKETEIYFFYVRLALHLLKSSLGSSLNQEVVLKFKFLTKQSIEFNIYGIDNFFNFLTFDSIYDQFFYSINFFKISALNLNILIILKSMQILYYISLLKIRFDFEIFSKLFMN